MWEYDFDPIGAAMILSRDVSKRLSELSDAADSLNSAPELADWIDQDDPFLKTLIHHKRVLDILLSISGELYARSRSSDNYNVTYAWDRCVQRIANLHRQIHKWSWIDTVIEEPKPYYVYPPKSDQLEKVNGWWDHVCKKPKPKKRKIGRVWTCRCGKSWKVQGLVGVTGWVEYDPE